MMQPTSQLGKFNRVDYVQVGLTSKNVLRLVRKTDQLIEVVVGDHTGSLQLLALKTDTNVVETVFKTLPGPNAKINCVEVFTGSNVSSSTRILASSGSSTIKGFNKKGKQFFSLELNNLTEPIKLFKMRWPEEIFVVGQYIYNSYIINSENINSNGGSSHFNLTSSSSKSSAYNSVVKSRHYYVCPERINDLVMLEDKLNRKNIAVLACQDRLLRVLKDSQCSFEVEICGIPTTVQIVPKYDRPSGYGNEALTKQSSIESAFRLAGKNENVHLCYGTLDGKIALVTFRFEDKSHLEPIHQWEVPQNAIKQPVTCLIFSQSNAEFFVGRSDGSVEVWRLPETIDDENIQSVDLFSPPVLANVYNCGESITNIVSIFAYDQADFMLLCTTFTGLLFGLIKHGAVLTQMRQLNPNYLIVSKENVAKIETLKDECDKLEKKLESERQKYEKQTTNQGINSFSNLSALPFFAVNDSFVLHNDASYVLILEVEVAIDVVIMHCDISLDLIDCERNSAVISFNDSSENNPNEMLATFRCQANTTRLEIRLRPVEGQLGTLSVYVISRITPKSCQYRSYTIQPLSLHKRQYSNTQLQYTNSLTISGPFGINDAHTWLRMCIPEIPEKLSCTVSYVESEVFHYISTITKSILICSCGKGLINISSDNVSTVSILKDFLTREATRQSIQIEINVSIAEKSMGIILQNLYPIIKNLILEKQRQELYEAISDLQTSDADIAAELLKDLRIQSDSNQVDGGERGDQNVLVKLSESSKSNQHDVLIGLDRVHGIVTDLFIDYHKLHGSSISSVLKMAKEKLNDMVLLIESIVLDIHRQIVQPIEENSAQISSTKREKDIFVERLYQFWEIHT